MLCKKPYIHGKHAYPCGQCLPCRFNRRRLWTHRIILEMQNHADNCFVTLTYRKPSYGPPDMSLRPRDAQLFLKRLRKAIAPTRIRYYLVGEYGEKNHGPHFHLALFGFPLCFNHAERVLHRRSRFARGYKNCCTPCNLLRDTWGHGLIDNAQLEVESAQYVAGYVTKKMTSTSDDRLNGRHPEFARMSKRPAIGLLSMFDIADRLLNFNLDLSEADVPAALRVGNRMMPLGRYLRRQLRLMIGKDANAPPHVIQKMEEDLLPMLEAARAASKGMSGDVFKEAFKHFIAEASVQEHRNFDARSKIFSSKKGKTL